VKQLVQSFSVTFVLLTAMAHAGAQNEAPSPSPTPKDAGSRRAQQPVAAERGIHASQDVPCGAGPEHSWIA